MPGEGLTPEERAALLRLGKRTTEEAVKQIRAAELAAEARGREAAAQEALLHGDGLSSGEELAEAIRALAPAAPKATPAAGTIARSAPPAPAAPPWPELEERCNTLRTIVEFAYESGFHEVGYDVVADLRAAVINAEARAEALAQRLAELDRECVQLRALVRSAGNGK